jgi:glycosyltransferase involved in cell wall biosynthesis
MNIVWLSKITMDTFHKTSRIKMSEALIKRGHTVRLCMVKKFGEKNFASDYITQFPTIDLPILSGIFYGLLVFFYFPFFLSKKNIDIIIIDCTKIPLLFVVPLKILNIPLILDIRTLPTEKEASFIFKLSIRLSKYIVDGITTITPDLNTILREEYDLKFENVGIWSSGVSVEDFDDADIKRPVERLFSDKKFTLLYHGGIYPKRGIGNLIQSINRLDEDIKDDIQLILLGSCPEDIKNKLFDLIETEGVSDQVVILPPVSYDKIPQYIAAADVGVIPLPPEIIYWWVSAPLKTLEYLATGRPVLVTDIPFHRKIFKKGDCGALLETGSPDDLATGIATLYKKRNSLKDMGSFGKKIVSKYYTWDYMAQEFDYFLKPFVKEY